MSIKSRIRRLEEERRNSPEPPCEKCGGQIIYEEFGKEKTRLPVLCALSCVVRSSTQPLSGYTRLILRQRGCNNL